jgi:phosphoenolpyruvate carboxylase
MPVKSKEEMKEYNRQLYLKRKERKMNASMSVNTEQIELVISELPVEEIETHADTQVEIKVVTKSTQHIEEIMRELMTEMFEEEKDEIIEGTVKYIYYKWYHKIHAFQKMYKQQLSPDYRVWIQNWRQVNKEFYKNQL